jgi:hypothetical protein
MNKALRIFALCWVAVVAVLNLAVVVGMALGNSWPFFDLRLTVLVLLVLFLGDAVLCTPALAAEWLRSMRIAVPKFRQHQLRYRTS